MRIRVKDVLELLASVVSEADILADYPCLQQEDISACVEFAEMTGLPAACIVIAAALICSNCPSRS